MESPLTKNRHFLDWIEEAVNWANDVVFGESEQEIGPTLPKALSLHREQLLACIGAHGRALER